MYPSNLINQLSDPRLKKRLSVPPMLDRVTGEDSPSPFPLDTQPTRIGLSANPPNAEGQNLGTPGPRLQPETTNAAPFSPITNSARLSPNQKTEVLNVPPMMGQIGMQGEQTNDYAAALGSRLPVTATREEMDADAINHLPYDKERLRASVYDKDPDTQFYEDEIAKHRQPKQKVKRGFWGNLGHHVLGAIEGLPYGLVGIGMGAANPDRIEEANFQNFTVPRLQQRARFAQATQDNMAQRISEQAARTGTDPVTGLPTEQARQRRLSQDSLDLQRDWTRRYQGQQLTNKDEDQALKEKLGLTGLDLRFQTLEDLIRHRGVTEGQTDTRTGETKRHNVATEGLGAQRVKLQGAGVAIQRARTAMNAYKNGSVMTPQMRATIGAAGVDASGLPETYDPGRVVWNADTGEITVVGANTATQKGQTKVTPRPQKKSGWGRQGEPQGQTKAYSSATIKALAEQNGKSEDEIKQQLQSENPGVKLIFN